MFDMPRRCTLQVVICPGVERSENRLINFLCISACRLLNTALCGSRFNIDLNNTVRRNTRAPVAASPGPSAPRVKGAYKHTLFVSGPAAFPKTLGPGDDNSAGCVKYAHGSFTSDPLNWRNTEALQEHNKKDLRANELTPF